MFENCTVIKDRRKIFTAKEEGKVYSLNNEPSFEIAKVKIDGCVFNEATKKCDWLFLVAEEKAIFVELKGSDITTGIKQLHKTYDRLRNRLGDRFIWFRLSIGEKNSVPRSIRGDKSYKYLFAISQDNLKIGKQLTDTLN
jgi:hypothetical protein